MRSSEPSVHSDKAPMCEDAPLDCPVPGATWLDFATIAAFAGTFFWLFWSVWMSVMLHRDLMAILLGAGAFCGISFGIFLGLFMAIALRHASLSFPVGDEEAFLSRLEVAMARNRYRPSDHVGAWRIYGTGAGIRPRVFDIAVRVEPGRATLAGPRASIKALKKRIERGKA